MGTGKQISDLERKTTMWVLFVLLGRRVFLPLLHGPGSPDLISVSYLPTIWVELSPKARSSGSWTLPSRVWVGWGSPGVSSADRP